MKQARAKFCRLCAFCTHWYDPGNAHIRLKYLNNGTWEYDEKAESICNVNPAPRPRKAWQTCEKWACKV